MTNRINRALTQNQGLAGRFLVASMALEGSPFARSVVFICQESNDGAFGVIVNRPANEALKACWQEAISSVGAVPNSATVLSHLQEGGPKGGPVVILHPHQSFAEVTVDAGVFLSANSEAISKIINLGDETYRIYCGISTWTRSQLGQEIQQGLWYPMDADFSQILKGEEIVWENAVLQYGRAALCDMLGVKTLRGNPLWN
jgi:putative transcriptional regulator